MAITATRVFYIQEIDSYGNAPQQQAPGLDRYEWTAAEHSAPVGSIDFTLKLRTVKEYYPGNTIPTEQVIGSHWEPMSVEGVWHDKYGGENFANDNMSRFTKLIQRGKMVRVGFEEFWVDGIITDVVFTYKRKSLVSYSFTLSPHNVSYSNTITSAPSRAKKYTKSNAANISKIVEEAKAKVDAVNKQLESPVTKNVNKAALVPALEFKDAWTLDLTGLQSTSLTRAFNTIEAGVSSAKRMSMILRSVRTRALQMIEHLGNLRSDIGVTANTVINELSWSTWSDSISTQCRAMILGSVQGEKALNATAEPTSLRLYKPQAGESLYTVSTKMYGTPHNWYAIAKANRISSMTLTGTETLVIPELTQASG